MNGKSACTVVPASARAVQDEWGMFDPNQAGLEAAFRAVRALAEPTPIAGAAPDSDGAYGDASRVTVPGAVSAASVRPAPARPVSVDERATASNRHRSSGPRAAGPTRIPPHAVSADETLYGLTDAALQPALKQPERGAIYTLEFPTRCPHCATEINTVRVSRLLRTQVSFTSTLPRKGYIIVCSECDGILSAELSGLI